MPAESILAAIRHCSDTLRLNGFETDALTLDQAARELSSSEESHRRVAGSFEEMAERLFANAFVEGFALPSPKDVASLLATVHKGAMERAAGIADEQSHKAEQGINSHFGSATELFYQFEASVSRTIAEAIRRAAAES